MRFSRKPLDPKRSNGVPRGQFQTMECTAGKRSSDGKTCSKSQSNWRTLGKQGLQDRVMQSRFVLVDMNEGTSTAETPLDTKASARTVVPGYADPDVLDIPRDSPTACREAVNVLLATTASQGREKRVPLSSVSVGRILREMKAFRVSSLSSAAEQRRFAMTIV